MKKSLFDDDTFGLRYCAEAVHENDIIDVNDVFHLGVADDLDDIRLLVEVVAAQRLRTYPYRRMAGTFPVIVQVISVVFESKGAFAQFPKFVDGFCHLAGAEVLDFGKVFHLPRPRHTCMADEIIFPDGKCDAMKQRLGLHEQESDATCILAVVSAGKLRDFWEISVVMVAVQKDDMVGMGVFVVDDFQEVALQIGEGYPQIWVEIVADKDVDAVFINQFLPGGSSVNVADDIVGGHEFVTQL